MTKELIEFKVYRSRWGNGSIKGIWQSSLFNSTFNKSCCLGFWTNQVCRIPFSKLDGIGTPAGLWNNGIKSEKLLPLLKDFTYSENKHSNYTVANLMAINDLPIGEEINTLNNKTGKYNSKPLKLRNEAHREELLTELFAKIGYKPIFVD